MLDLLRNYVDYNSWAHERLIAYLRQRPKEDFEQTFVASFPSICKTLLHIWDAQVIWLDRLKGKSAGAWPAKNYRGDHLGVLDGLMNSIRAWQVFLAKQDDRFEHRVFTYQNLSGRSYRQAGGEITLHCINHSTYHRGQVIMMLRQLEAPNLPGTDYIYYVRSKTTTDG